MKTHRHLFLSAAILVCCSATAATSLYADQPSMPSTTPESTPKSATTIAIHLAAQSHLSGIYHITEKADFTLLAENPSDTPLTLAGTIEFGPITHTNAEASLTVTTTIPITPTVIAPHQRVQLPVNVAFGGAGLYGLQWTIGGTHTLIETAEHEPLECIFAPRSAKAAPSADDRWLTTLPPTAGHAKNILTDFIKQRHIRKFMWDDRFAFDPETGIALAAGAGRHLSTEQRADLLDDLRTGGGTIVWRVKVDLSEKTDAARTNAFHAFIADLAEHAKDQLGAIVIEPTEKSQEWSAAQRAAFRSLYLAAYEAAKANNPKCIMLGAGSLNATQNLLMTHEGGDTLHAYVDAWGVESIDDIDPVFLDAKASGGNTPPPTVWLLSPELPADALHLPPAVALGEGASVVPIPDAAYDNGVALHLLGGAAVFQKVPGAALPYIVTFQGDGFAVAAVAGLSAGTPLDREFGQMTLGKTLVAPAENDQEPTTPNLEVGDDTDSLRVVDSKGAPLNCREGDTLYVPAGDRVAYVLQAGSAEDLLGLLRAGTPNRLPLFSVAATVTAKRNAGQTLTIRLTNKTLAEVGGLVRVFSADQPPATRLLVQQKLIPLTPEHFAEFPIDIPTTDADGNAIPPLARGTPLIVEIQTTVGIIQRTAVIPEFPH